MGLLFLLPVDWDGGWVPGLVCMFLRKDKSLVSTGYWAVNAAFSLMTILMLGELCIWDANYLA
jgi:hypothetical protein